jgi:hypothetical protein
MLGRKPLFAESSEIPVIDIVVVDQIGAEWVFVFQLFLRRKTEVLEIERSFAGRR